MQYMYCSKGSGFLWQHRQAMRGRHQPAWQAKEGYFWVGMSWRDQGQGSKWWEEVTWYCPPQIIDVSAKLCIVWYVTLSPMHIGCMNASVVSWWVLWLVLSHLRHIITTPTTRNRTTAYTIAITLLLAWPGTPGTTTPAFSYLHATMHEGPLSLHIDNVIKVICKCCLDCEMEDKQDCSWQPPRWTMAKKTGKESNTNKTIR